MLGLTVACALVAGFTGPHASRVMPRSRACMMSDEEPAAPTPMAPSFTLSMEGITLKEQYAKDFAASAHAPRLRTQCRGSSRLA